MKAEELRIGNFVIDTETSFVFNEESVIEIKDGDDIDFCGDYEPIPLTEEWLEKFGFEKEDDFYSIKLIHLLYGKDSCDFNYGDKGCLYSIRGIKYVHTLQNLYFALTNAELETKD